MNPNETSRIGEPDLGKILVFASLLAIVAAGATVSIYRATHKPPPQPQLDAPINLLIDQPSGTWTPATDNPNMEFAAVRWWTNNNGKLAGLGVIWIPRTNGHIVMLATNFTNQPSTP